MCFYHFNDYPIVMIAMLMYIYIYIVIVRINELTFFVIAEVNKLK